MLTLLLLLVLLAGRANACLVLSNSMSPALRQGDLVFLRPLAEKDVLPGMIVSYRWDGKLITHRVRQMQDGFLTTQGDNNLQPDPWLTPLANVAGTPVLRIPLLGYVLLSMRSPAGWAIMVLLPALVLLFVLVQNLLRLVRIDRLPAAERRRLVVRRIPARMRWLHRIRRGGYRLSVRARHTLFLPVLAGLILAWPLAGTGQATWAYFNAVRRLETRFATGSLNLGAQLTGTQAAVTTANMLNSTLPQLAFETCVENQGKSATENLEILAILQMAGQDGAFREVRRQAVDLSGAPQIKAGQKHCYRYTLPAGDEGVLMYRVLAQVSVTNLEGWLPGSKACPGPAACRKGITLSAEAAAPQPSPSPTPTLTLTPTGLPVETSPTPMLTQQPSETITLEPAPENTQPVDESTPTPSPQPTLESPTAEPPTAEPSLIPIPTEEPTLEPTP